MWLKLKIRLQQRVEVLNTADKLSAAIKDIWENLSVDYIYNFILHLHMDPGGKIYTIDEFRCWKVENLDDERSDENKNEGGG